MARQLDAKSLVESLDGRREPMVPVYQFGNGETKYEHPNHNPFEFLNDEPDDPEA